MPPPVDTAASAERDAGHASRDTWPRGGRAALAARVTDVGDRIADAMGWAAWAERGDLRATTPGVALLDAAADLVTTRLRDDDGEHDPAAVRRLAAVLVDLHALRDDVRERLARERSEAQASVSAAMRRLRRLESATAALQAAPAELCHSCGFDRSILFRIRDSRMVAEGVHYTGDPDGAARLLAVGREHPGVLDGLLLETEMIRRRMPVLVEDAQNDPRVHRAVAVASGSVAYVAAPIMPEGRVIGFFHADRTGRGRPLDATDLERIWMFAEAFGNVFERAVLVDRLRVQRNRVRDLLAASEAVVADPDGPPPRLPSLDGGDADGGVGDGDASTTTAAPAPGLTPREVEVVTLMARGATNGEIARELVISEGTIKSHVKHILRKLGAANRAEAVSRHLRGTGMGR